MAFDGLSDNLPSIAALTPTVCRLMGVRLPSVCGARAIEEVADAEKSAGGPARIDRCLIYAPDAIGRRLCRQQGPCFDQVRQHAPQEVAVRAAFPSVTPVCFASMFTGAAPEVHGITKYERPVLRCDTLFDALARAGKRTAIVAVRNSSMDRIFREREIDYFSEDYDGEVTVRAKALLESGDHDLLVAYHQEYDDALHRTSPTSPDALRAMRHHVGSFAELAEAFHLGWGTRDRCIVFAPDHGAHTDPATGRGTHGLDIPEDMQVLHFYGLWRGSPS